MVFPHPKPGTEEAQEMLGAGWIDKPLLHAELNANSGLFDGYVTLVSEYTWHLWLFTLSPHASVGTGIGQMARYSGFSALHPFCKSHLGKS